MAKVQGKKAAAASKKAVKKVVARVKSAAVVAKKKVVAKKAAAPQRPAAKKLAAKKPAAKPAPRPAAKPAGKLKAAAKAVKSVAKKTVGKPAKAIAKTAPKAPVAAAKTKAAPKMAPAPTLKIVAPVAAPPRPVAARAPEPEKKRGRRARPRVHSTGAPAAAWLSTEKPRPASFIPAPARAEAPSAIAAPPASSDRLIRPDDVDHPAVRTVPVRIDVEQGPGRFYVIAYPIEVSVRVSEGIEWDFRYIGGADVSVEEIAVEFDKPSPFAQTSFRTRKPGGARPHRQLSGGALPSAAGKRIEYKVRAMTPFKTELASTKIWVNVTA